MFYPIYQYIMLDVTRRRRFSQSMRSFACSLTFVENSFFLAVLMTLGRFSKTDSGTFGSFSWFLASFVLQNMHTDFRVTRGRFSCSIFAQCIVAFCRYIVVASVDLMYRLANSLKFKFNLGDVRLFLRMTGAKL